MRRHVINAPPKQLLKLTRLIIFIELNIITGVCQAPGRMFHCGEVNSFLPELDCGVRSAECGVSVIAMSGLF